MQDTELSEIANLCVVVFDRLMASFETKSLHFSRTRMSVTSAVYT